MLGPGGTGPAQLCARTTMTTWRGYTDASRARLQQAPCCHSGIAAVQPFVRKAMTTQPGTGPAFLDNILRDRRPADSQMKGHPEGRPFQFLLSERAS
jgi:hypothetical protein